MAHNEKWPTLAVKRAREEKGDGEEEEEERIPAKRARSSATQDASEAAPSVARAAGTGLVDSGELMCSESAAPRGGLRVGESVEGLKRAFQKEREQRREQLDQVGRVDTREKG